jgi:hypothetical protein
MANNADSIYPAMTPLNGESPYFPNNPAIPKTAIDEGPTGVLDVLSIDVLSKALLMSTQTEDSSTVGSDSTIDDVLSKALLVSVSQTQTEDSSCTSTVGSDSTFLDHLDILECFVDDASLHSQASQDLDSLHSRPTTPTHPHGHGPDGPSSPMHMHRNPNLNENVGFGGLCICPEYEIHDINKYGSMASFIGSRVEQGPQQETGSFLVTNLTPIIMQYQQWVSELPMVQPFYAVKCNPDPVMLRLLASMGCGFDCATQVPTVF